MSKYCILKVGLRGSKARQYDLESDFDVVEHECEIFVCTCADQIRHWGDCEEILHGIRMNALESPEYH